MNAKLWLEDPRVLLQDLEVVVPTSSMTSAQAHNAVMRAVIYACVLLALLFSNSRFLYVILIAGALSAVVYYFRKKEAFRAAKKLNAGNVDIIDDRVCAKSTVENPFMNVLITDYEMQPQRPQACPVDHPKVQPLVDDNFDARLFKDVGDVYGKEHSQRQFYTMPNTTIPNNQEAFAKWLYGIPEPSCKEGNGDSCLRNMHTPIQHL